MVQVIDFQLGPMQTNCYLVTNGSEAIVIDPGGDPESLLNYVKRNGIKPTLILNTHFHLDHILGNSALQQATGLSILASPEDGFLLQDQIGGGGFGFPKVEPFDYESLTPGEREWLGETCRILSTPGHSPGSLSFHFPESGKLFSGDLLFAGSVGRTDLPGGDMQQLLTAVKENVFVLPESTVIYPGHGPETTVGQEMKTNPFFQGGGFL
jgi:glyoxylase-like metal-dependent hydrolase (beta-lactamase superfamily II)